MSQVPELDVFVDPDNPKDGIEKIVKQIRPEWNLKDLKIQDLSTGYINRNLKISAQHGNEGALFLQTANPAFADYILYRHVGLFIHQNNLGKKFPCFFKNGVCQEFLSGETMSWDERSRQYEDRIWKATAKTVARLHSRDIFKKALDYNLQDMVLNHPPPEMLQAFENVKLREDLPPTFRDIIPNPEEWLQERKWYISFMESIGAEKTVTHSDINPTNIVMQDEKAILIDYDVVGLGLPATEIAWHFTCYGDLRNLDLSEYPSDEHQRKWFRQYLTCRRQFDADTEPVTEDDITRLKQYVYYGKMGSFLQVVMATVIILCLTMDTDKGFLAPQTAIVAWEAFKAIKKEVMDKPPTL